MNFKKLGNTDLKVSTICLGTMTWGEQNNINDAFKQMDYAVDQGVNFFDTAELYAVPMKPETRGKTSQFIGEWFLKTKKRNKVILADKVVGASKMPWLRPGGEKACLNKVYRIVVLFHCIDFQSNNMPFHAQVSCPLVSGRALAPTETGIRTFYSRPHSWQSSS